MSVIASAANGVMQGIGAIAQVASQGARHRHEKALNERSIQAQKDMAEYQYGKDLEQWNRANEYNAPTAQMARLRAAGLNPKLIYGRDSSGAAGMAAQSPKYQAVRPEYNYSPPINPLAALGAYQDFQQKNAQIDLTKAAVQKENALAKSAEARAEYDEFYYNARADNALYQSLVNLYKSQGMRGTVPAGTTMPLWGKRQIAQYKYETGRLEKQQKDIDLVKNRSDLTKAQADWYVTNMLWRLGIGSINALTGGLGKVAGSFMKQLPKTAKPGIRYNSPGSWRQMGF